MCPPLRVVIRLVERFLPPTSLQIGNRHRLNFPGLQQIQNWLQSYPQLANICSSADRPWRFIFIVPPGNASTFESQQLGCDTRNQWVTKVNRYVLGLDVLGEEQNNV